MKSNPLVTVYIPTYNRVELLKRAVRSVLEQTYQNIELIILDDCSTDNTLMFLESLVKHDDRVRFFQNEKNSGACVSRNKAIREAKGEYITGLDDDDYFLGSRIADFVEFWQENINDKNVVCLFAERFFLKKTRISPPLNMPVVVDRNSMLHTNYIGNQVFTKIEYLRSNLFDTKLKMWQDFDCWYRLLDGGKVAINTQKANYIVDVSHPHERITSAKVEKAYQTYKYFVKKYNLSKKDSDILESHLYDYDRGLLTLNKVFRMFFIHQNYRVSHILFRKYCSFLLRKYRVIKE
ncbi:glycosyltransferase like 2 family protein [Francisella philomiragia]|uniref:glycosyltransferase n=1 Tax=Francisella philomiragia TaxID=28110 RepID=UPI0005A582B8|nr:glycosyltransferase [Francisella philomiragia]AJI56845.1 glycosyltransferase like 2 family protein [Francisella philomiragia]